MLVGDDPASHVYVGSKKTQGTDVGFRVDLHQRPATTSLDEVLALVRSLNADPAIDGILVQSPLPAAMGSDAARRVFETIDPAKDVDGFTAENVGRLVQNREGLVACTPAGIIELLEQDGVTIAGKRAVVIGRSDIVGKPMALLLLHRHATVTIAHSKTPDLPAVAREADILVAAIGRAGFVTPAFVKPGATVVDVGMNRVSRRSRCRGVLRRGLEASPGLAAARVGADGRCPPRCCRRRGGADASARRRRSADDRHADEEHPHGGVTAHPVGRVPRTRRAGGAHRLVFNAPSRSPLEELPLSLEIPPCVPTLRSTRDRAAGEPALRPGRPCPQRCRQS